MAQGPESRFCVSAFFVSPSCSVSWSKANHSDLCWLTLPWRQHNTHPLSRHAPPRHATPHSSSHHFTFKSLLHVTSAAGRGSQATRRAISAPGLFQDLYIFSGRNTLHKYRRVALRFMQAPAIIYTTLHSRTLSPKNFVTRSKRLPLRDSSAAVRTLSHRDRPPRNVVNRLKA